MSEIKIDFYVKVKILGNRLFHFLKNAKIFFHFLGVPRKNVSPSYFLFDFQEMEKSISYPCLARARARNNPFPIRN